MMHAYTQQHKGFTLLETVIYLALYALIFTGALVGVYSVFESSSRNQTKAMVSQEGTYLIGKIDWALGHAQSITAPLSGAEGTDLSVTQYDGTIVGLSIADGALTLDGETLNNTNVRVVLIAADNGFVHDESSLDGLTPESLRASFTLTATTSQGLPYAQSFSTVRYLRK